MNLRARSAARRVTGRALRTTRRIRWGRPPVVARHCEWSVIASADDIVPSPNDRLVHLVLDAAQVALVTRLPELVERSRTGLQRKLVEQWPGEHYRLLAGLVEVLQPSLCVEVGTFTGMGTLALRPPAGNVVTFDIEPWKSFDDTLLRSDDFTNGIEQRIGDLADQRYFAEQLETLREADLIFVDGPKDGTFEHRFSALLLPALRGTKAVVVFDDIRVLNMLQLWRNLDAPKLDATSFGHWSGTGLAEML